MFIFANILGLEQSVAIIVVVVVAFFALSAIFLYLSSVFVDKKYNKIVERIGKYKKTVTPGWHFIIPLLDSVVESIDMSERIKYSPKEVSILDKKKNAYTIDYSIKFKVVDAAKYYYSSATFVELLFSNCSNKIVDHYKDKTFDSSSDILNINNNELLETIKPIGEELGIEILEIIIISISK